MTDDTIKEFMDDVIRELYTGEYNYNNADPTNGQIVYSREEIIINIKEYLEKLLK